MTDKNEVIKLNHAARIDEVLQYQINIDNYRLALIEVEKRNDPDLEDFRVQLENLLSSSIREQKKAQIMLDVLAKQLEG